MANYYVDLGGTWAARQTGLNNTGDQWQGPGGLDTALRTVTAGNTCYVKGTAIVNRFVYFNNLGDVTGWEVGDLVQNDTGDGDDWTGIIIEYVSTTQVVVELDIGSSGTDVNNADGIENTTKAETTTIAAQTIYYFWDNTYSGTKAGGHIKFIGVNSSWVEDGTQAVLDLTDSTFGFIAGGSSHYIWFQNWEIKNGSTGVYANDATCLYWVFINCTSNTNAYGWDTNNAAFDTWTFINCQAHTNTERGFNDGDLNTIYLNCIAYNNGDAGFRTSNNHGMILYNCVSHNNDVGAYVGGEDCVIVNSVFDSNTAGVGIGIQVWDDWLVLLNNRITNNSNGINFGGNYPSVCGWNYLHNNTTDLVTPSAWSDVGIYAAYISDDNELNTNIHDKDSDDGYNAQASDDFNLKYDRKYCGDGGDGDDILDLDTGS